MERYNEYKDSGVQWLGEIPSHWETRPLKYSCSLKGRIGWNGLRSDEFQDTAFAYLVTGQDFIGSEIDWSKCYQISRERYDEDPFIQLKNGDMLITKDGTIGKVAKVTNLDKPACLNSGIFVIKQKGSFFNQGFLYWMLCSNVLKEFNVYTQTGATIAHLYQNVFENMPCLLPPISEQQAIATYLDTATAKIDEAIAQQQKMIDLLNERKQIIINNAVTKGLNPDAPMKDSGVEWIGEIPEHWEIMPLKRCCELVREKCIKAASFRVALENIESWSGTYIDTTSEYDGLGVQFKKGDILFGKLRPYLAKVYLAEKDGEALGDIWTLRSNSSCFSGYIHKILLSKKIIDVIDSSTYGTKMPRADWGTNSKLCIPVPPFSEQETITSFLDSISFKIECAISNATNQISLLQERKQIIINDVVTGKVKVS